MQTSFLIVLFSMDSKPVCTIGGVCVMSNCLFLRSIHELQIAIRVQEKSSCIDPLDLASLNLIVFFHIWTKLEVGCLYIQIVMK